MFLTPPGYHSTGCVHLSVCPSFHLSLSVCPSFPLSLAVSLLVSFCFSPCFSLVPTLFLYVSLSVSLLSQKLGVGTEIRSGPHWSLFHGVISWSFHWGPPVRLAAPTLNHLWFSSNMTVMFTQPHYISRNFF